MTQAQAEYLFLSDALKRRRGTEFEDHGHPAVLLDRAVGSMVRVWGWWAPTVPNLPCLLWASERGWSTTVVEPAQVGEQGYDLAHWSHRAHLLDLALANAIGPMDTLGRLELCVATDEGATFGPFGGAVADALLWGIEQLRSARPHRNRLSSVSLSAQCGAAAPGSVDGELAKHSLVPMVDKPTPDARRAGWSMVHGAALRQSFER